MANQQNMEHFQQLLQKNNSNLPINVVLGQSRDAMAASDAILLACGTATLEALLLRKPMVVAYKVSNFTYHLAKHLVKVDKFSFPNLLSKEHLVPEFIQDNATPENLGQAIIEQLNNPSIIEPLLEQYKAIHLGLRTDANQCAAEAVLGLLAIRKSLLQELEL